MIQKSGAKFGLFLSRGCVRFGQAGRAGHEGGGMADKRSLLQAAAAEGKRTYRCDAPLRGCVHDGRRLRSLVAAADPARLVMTMKSLYGSRDPPGPELEQFVSATNAPHSAPLIVPWSNGRCGDPTLLSVLVRVPRHRAHRSKGGGSGERNPVRPTAAGGTEVAGVEVFRACEEVSACG